MASGKYKSGRIAVMRGQIDFVNDAIGALLIDADLYSVDLDTDLGLSDIPDAAILSNTVLTGKSLDETEVTLFADPLIFLNVPVSTEEKSATAVVLFLDKEDYSDCILIAYFDDLAGFPVEPDDTDITVNWDAEGILIG